MDDQRQVTEWVRATDHEDFLDNTNCNTNVSNNDSETAPFNLNTFIDRLTAVKDRGKQIPLRESDITTICSKSRLIFLDQPVLLELEGPLKVCGDIHGQYSDLLRLFDLCGYPGDVNYLFLGDYVDRGKQSLETICLLFAYKIKYPNNFFLLRGNHECQAITRIYGFYDECKRRYAIKIWKTFLDVFNCIPVAAIIENQIFCCHGGLSPELLKPEINNLDKLKRRVSDIARPTEVPETGILCDLLWSDPWYPEVQTESAFRDLKGWGPNERGVSYVFAPDIVDIFLARFGLDLIVRAHQVVEDGYEFYAKRSLVTIFSAPNYCGEFDNAGGILCLNRNKTYNPKTKEEEVDLEGSFQILHPYAEVKKKLAKQKKQQQQQQQQSTATTK